MGAAGALTTNVTARWPVTAVRSRWSTKVTDHLAAPAGRSSTGVNVTGFVVPDTVNVTGFFGQAIFNLLQVTMQLIGRHHRRTIGG